MNEQEKKVPSPEELAAKMKAMGQNPDVMQQATKLLNMAYAFQFAQTAVPRVALVQDGKSLDNRLIEIHKEGGVIVSVILTKNVENEPPEYQIVYYGKE